MTGFVDLIQTMQWTDVFLQSGPRVQEVLEASTAFAADLSVTALLGKLMAGADGDMRGKLGKLLDAAKDIESSKKGRSQRN